MPLSGPFSPRANLADAGRFTVWTDNSYPIAFSIIPNDIYDIVPSAAHERHTWSFGNFNNADLMAQTVVPVINDWTTYIATNLGTAVWLAGRQGWSLANTKTRLQQDGWNTDELNPWYWDRWQQGVDNVSPPTSSPDIANSFAYLNPSKLYVVGDEPEGQCDGDYPPLSVHSPSRYADWYHRVVELVRFVDPTARFAPAGMIANAAPWRCNEAEPWQPTDTLYLEAFDSIYRARYGGPPPIAEWRFHLGGQAVSVTTGFGADLNARATWAVSSKTNHTSASLVVGSMSLGQDGLSASAYLDSVGKAMSLIYNDWRVIRATWWHAYADSRPLFTSGTLNDLGNVWAGYDVQLSGPEGNVYVPGDLTWTVKRTATLPAWDVSYNNGSTWTAAGTGPSLTLTVSGTYTLIVRVTAASSNGTSVQRTKTLYVDATQW